MELKKGVDTRTTVVSIGMRSLEGGEHPTDPLPQSASGPKSFARINLNEKLSSLKTDAELSAVTHRKSSSIKKRKRTVSFDSKLSNDFSESPDVILALGSFSHRRNPTGLRDLMEESTCNGVDPSLTMALGNSLWESCFESSGGSCTEDLPDTVSMQRVSSEEQPEHLQGSISSAGVEKGFILESDLLSRLGNYAHGSDYQESCGFSGYPSKQLWDEPTEGSNEVPLTLGIVGTSMRSRSLGESRSPCFKARVEGVGSFLGLGQSNQLSDIACEQLAQPQHIPVVDEGSSSARWLKAGGLMPSLLETSKVHQEFQNTPMIDSMGNSAIVVSHNPELMKPEKSISIRPSSGGTTSASGPSGARDRASKTCKFRGCGKGARGTSGLCIAHGGGRRCQRPGCNKGAEGRTVYCKAHGGGRRCQTLGCTKSAEGRTDFCIAHGGGRRCSHEGCVKAARGRSGLCIRHGGGKRCQREGCTKSAEGYTGLCISHGGGRRCQYEGCTKGAQGSTKFCKGHGGGKRCIMQGCNKGAEGSTPLCKGHGGGKRCMYEGGGICTKSVHGGTLYCVAHGGGKRCAIPDCTKSARGKTDFCVRHGGGKRCKVGGCGKSAQGSTDFCKAHGGGKRCTWGQEGSVYGPDPTNGDGDGSSRIACDKFARGRLGLCAAHAPLAQDQRGHGRSSSSASSGPGLSKGYSEGLVSGYVQGTENTGLSMNSEVMLPNNFSSPVSLSSISASPSKYSLRTGTSDMEGAEAKRLKSLETSNEILKASNGIKMASLIVNERCSEAGVKISLAEKAVLGLELAQRKALDGASMNPSHPVIVPANYWPGLRPPLPFTFGQWSAPRGVISSVRCLPSGAAESMAISTSPGTSIPLSLIHPQHSVQLAKPKNSLSTTLLSSTVLEGESYNNSSSLVPEGRVRGGSFLAMFAGAAPDKNKE